MCDKSTKFVPIDYCVVELGEKKYLIRQTGEEVVLYYEEKTDCQNRPYWDDMGKVERPSGQFLVAILRALSAKDQKNG